VGTLYVTVAPEGNPDAFTLRALRLLQEVAIVFTEDIPHAQRLLAHHRLAVPLVGLDDTEASLTTIETNDALLLLDGWRSSPSGPSHGLVRSAIERGFTVAPVPGPTLPIAALVASGLPADSFVYIGMLPSEATAQRALLATVAHERRTLVAMALTLPLPALVETLGQRPLALASTSDQGVEIRRWSMLAEAFEALEELPVQRPFVLIIGGQPQQAIRWDEDSLQAEIRERLGQGLTAKETGRELAAESGWPRREIYRLAVEMRRSTRLAAYKDKGESRSDGRADR
jgi:16S rRNA (cytidine1402-2'-O)-methyltransferase